MKTKKALHVYLRGGLGNQLFQYSTGIALAQEQKRELVIRGDLLPRAEDTIGSISRWPNQIIEFDHSGRVITKSYQPSGKTNSFGKIMQLMRLTGERFPNLVSKIGWLASESAEPLLGLPNQRITLINSYAAFKDFAHKNRMRLRRELSQLIEPSQEFLSFSSAMLNSNPIAVHIRQGDYLNLGHIYGNVSLAFLERAIEELRGELEMDNLWLFSDTPSAISSEVMGLLKPERVIGPGILNRPIENMLLMSKASGFIAANSSFSWWSALLTQSGTPVVAPHLASARVNNFSSDSELDQQWRILSV